MEGLALYSLRCFAAPARADVRLDRLDDDYGSPSLDDIEKFSRALGAAFEAAVGEEAAGEVALEVSTPGAERELVLPGDLKRFAPLPLWVEYDTAAAVVSAPNAKSKKSKGEGGSGGDGDASAEAPAAAAAAAATAAASVTAAVLQLVSLDEASGSSEWCLADVRANAPGKGRGLSRRQRDQRWAIPLAALRRVRVHVDF
jgi:ribosome maturation factor RimP